MPVIFEFSLSQSDENGNILPVPWEKNNKVNIPAGRMLKFYFKPIKNAFLYIYYIDTQNYLELIFPNSFSFFDNAYSGENVFFIPPEEDWFFIDGEVEFDRFYIFVSCKRMKYLEELTNNFLNCNPDTSAEDASAVNNAKQIRIKHDLLEEIKRLLNLSSPNTYKEDLVQIIPFSGTVKSVEEISQFAKRIEAEEFYAKTIEMEH